MGSLTKMRKWFGFEELLKTSILRDLSWQMVSTVVVVVFGFMQSILVAKNLGLDQFGVFALGLGLASIVSQLLDFRYTDILVKYLTEFSERGDYNQSLKLLMVALLMCITLLFFGFIFFFFTWEILESIYSAIDGMGLYSVFIVCLGNVFISTQLNYIFQSVLRVNNMIAQLAFINAMLYVSRVVALAIGFYYFELNLTKVVLILLLVNILFMFLFAFFSLNFLIRKVNFRNCIKELPLYKIPLGINSFAGNSYLTSVSSIPTKDLDITILGLFSTAEVLGLYRMAKNFSAAVWTFVDQIVLIIYADFSRKYAQMNLSAIRSTIAIILAVSVCVCAIGWVIAYTYLGHIIILVLSEDYLQSVEIFLIIFAGAFIWGPLVWVTPLALTFHMPQVVFKASLLTSILLVLLFLSFTYYWGVIGTAIISALSPVLVSLFCIKFLSDDDDDGLRRILTRNTNQVH